ncbi:MULTISPECIES: restriction endonuclease [Priestia]|uniref:restriction endonuclease n=1 Tax=Priestia TaxID=2800373 RepID=UPI001F1330EF|nr:restriction endonuclease [Priestia megaterium]UMZ35570.1 restriction endonuclease [Priestia megaterium]
MYKEEDIDFSIVADDVVFENVCVDLIRSLGSFHAVGWREGSFDGGRDIEGYTVVDYPLVGKKTEKWFFECKYYTGGVPLTVILDKIAWAIARKVDKLVIITSTHLTTQAKDYIEEVDHTVPTKIYAISGAELKSLIIKHPEIVEKYFINSHQKSAKSALNDYFLFDDVASISRVEELSKHVKNTRYTFYEVVHLLGSYLSYPEEHGFGFPIDEIPDLIEEIKSRGSFNKDTCLKKYQTHLNSLPYINNNEMNYTIHNSDFILKARSRFTCLEDNEKNSSYFFLEKTDQSVAIEIFISPTKVENWSVSIYEKKNIKSIYKKVKNYLGF